MKDPKEQEYDFGSIGSSTALMGRLAWGPCALMEPFLDISMGHNHVRDVALRGGITLVVATVALPRHPEINAFSLAWGSAVAVQFIVATWRRQFGRVHSRYVGFPLIAKIIPLGERFVRRFINPLATYWLASQVPSPAIAFLLKLSAAGQLIVWSIFAWVKAADDDLKRDLEIDME